MPDLWQIVKRLWRQSGLDRRLADAAGRGDADRVAALLRQGASVEARGREGMTVLTLAASGGHVETVRLLLDAGAALTPHGPSGWMPLFLAAASGETEIVRLLLERGADPDARDVEHEVTALMATAQEGDQEAVRMLIAAGADLSAIDWMGRTALDYAQEARHFGIAALLAEACALNGSAGRD